MLEGKKVISPEEMRRIETAAFSEGCTKEAFMDRAGEEIAKVALHFLRRHHLSCHVYLLIGKGNNGADAYTAGYHLIKQGVFVTALHLFDLDVCSSLCKKKHDQFKQAGGNIHYLSSEELFSFSEKGIILDGLLGTGFKKKVDGILAYTIAQANRSRLPILSIDIPSGLNPSNGDVETVAIYATETIFLGFPKTGFFIGKGWNHVGVLVGVEFGLPAHLSLQASEEMYLIAEKSLTLPRICRTRHKYEAGYILAFAGSPGMEGAAALSCLAALKAGAGVVRLFHFSEISSCHFPLELLHEPYSLKRVCEEIQRAKAALIGPGLGREKGMGKIVATICSHLTIPVVLDADGLYFYADNPFKLPSQSILTPHHKEMERLLKGKKPSLSLCQTYVDHHQVTLILKGAPTFIFHPLSKPLVVTRGDPGMATAGSGDVLTGILAALLAQGLDPRSAASLGVFLHGVAGEKAAKEKTSYSLIASDLIGFLPYAFKTLEITL